MKNKDIPVLAAAIVIGNIGTVVVMHLADKSAGVVRKFWAGFKEGAKEGAEKAAA